jgi:hypothetical protein
MTPLESLALALIRGAWNADAYRIRVPKLAAALCVPVEAARAAIDALVRTGELVFIQSAGHGRQIKLTRPPDADRIKLNRNDFKPNVRAAQ